MSSNEGVVESVGEVKEEVKRFFKMSFFEANYCKRELDGLDFKFLSQAESGSLEEPFPKIESSEAIWSYAGPDDFNFVFYQK